MHEICEVKNSPMLVKAANQLYKRMNRNRSGVVKRLNSTLSSYQAKSNLSAIAENVSTCNFHNSQLSESSFSMAQHNTSVTNAANNSKIANNNNTNLSSPTTTKPIFFSTELKCSTESIDL
jgi:hypothetical protein